MCYDSDSQILSTIYAEGGIEGSKVMANTILEGQGAFLHCSSCVWACPLLLDSQEQKWHTFNLVSLTRNDNPSYITRDLRAQ